MVKNATVKNTFKPNTGIITQHPTKFETTTTTSTSTTTTSISTTTSTTTLPTTILVYGCARFTTAGDLYFNISHNNAEKCVSECSRLDPTFRFFVTSFFLM